MKDKTEVSKFWILSPDLKIWRKGRCAHLNNVARKSQTYAVMVTFQVKITGTSLIIIFIFF